MNIAFVFVFKYLNFKNKNKVFFVNILRFAFIKVVFSIKSRKEFKTHTAKCFNFYLKIEKNAKKYKIF